MSAGLLQLRALQKDHNLILLHSAEFAALRRGSIALPDRHREHFGRVLRRRETWPALVGDGEGRLLKASVAGERITAEDANLSWQRKSPGESLTLVQAWVKQKALATILAKCAEIGVDEIRLVESEYAQPHSEKPQRMEAILENACMQAYNPVKPRLTLTASLAAAGFSGETFFGDLAATTPLTALKPGWPRTFVNGPEGGFSAAELEMLRSRATGVLLSENVLRSDSAAIIALGFLKLRA